MSASYNNGTVTFNGPNEYFTTEVVNNGSVSILPVTTVAGFVGGDRIELAASFMFSTPIGFPEYIPAGAENVINGITFFSPNPDFDYFEVGDGNNGHSVSTFEGFCLASGSMIATPEGPRAIETLRPGDRILCHAGGAPVPRPVVGCETWTCDLATAAQPRDAAPVRIAPDAFADGVPVRELVVSPNHAIHADRMLVPARQLINGLSIVQDFATGSIRYVHVEVAGHDLMAAEGLLVETRLPLPATMPRPAPLGAWSRLWEAQGCAPLVVSGAALEALRTRLLARAAQRGLFAGGSAGTAGAQAA